MNTAAYVKILTMALKRKKRAKTVLFIVSKNRKVRLTKKSGGGYTTTDGPMNTIEKQRFDRGGYKLRFPYFD